LAPLAAPHDGRLPAQPFGGRLHVPLAAIGPIPLADADAVLQQLGGPAGVRIGGDREVKIGATAYKPVLVDGRFIHMNTFFGQARTNTHSAYLLFCVLNNPGDWTARIHIAMPDTDVWLGGQPVAPLDRIALKRGSYPLLIRIRLGEKAPGNLGFSIHFTDSTKAADVAGWHADVKRNRAILDRIVKYRPDSELAARARTILKRADEHAAAIRQHP
jgi:hypothetical protein